MNIELETLITIAGVLVSATTAFVISRSKQDALWDNFRELKEKVEKQDNWCVLHSSSSYECKMNVAKELGELRAQLAIKNEQFSEIIRRFDEFKDALDDIRTHISNGRK